MKLVKVLWTVAMVPLVASSLVRAEGLRGWWKCDEGSGEKVADASGQGHDGKLSGRTAWVEGRIGSNALKLDGGALKIADNPLLRASRFTVAMWVNFAESQRVGGFARLLQIGDDNHEVIYILGSSSAHDNNRTSNEVTLSVSGGAGATMPSISTTKPFEGGKWFHLAAVYDGSDLSLYVDGKVAARKTVGEVKLRAAEGGPMVVGSRPPNMDRGFLGCVDDIRLYDKALSADEVRELAGAAAKGAGKQAQK
jgi:hypothetical protein